MKFKVRFADQIVGVFIVISLLSVVAVVVLLGRSQRWFSKDLSFTTILPSANGLSKNMPVQYRGFAIGNIKNFHLTEDDDVEVNFTVFEEYSDRMRVGTIVEMQVSPIGLGNQFLLHSGRGEPLVEGAFVPVIGSAQARELMRQDLAVEPRYDDSISMLMNRANSILAQIDEALGPGSDITEIGIIFRNLQRTLSEVQNISVTVDDMLTDLEPSIVKIVENIDDITSQINDPDSLVYKVLDTDEAVYTNLANSLASLSSILDNLDKATVGMFPNVAGLIMEVRTTIRTAEDVLVALTNNPLLRRGIPERVESQSGGTSPRDIKF